MTNLNDRTLILAVLFFGGLILLAVGLCVCIGGVGFLLLGEVETAAGLLLYEFPPMCFGLVGLMAALVIAEEEEE